MFFFVFLRVLGCEKKNFYREEYENILPVDLSLNRQFDLSFAARYAILIVFKILKLSIRQLRRRSNHKKLQ